MNLKQENNYEKFKQDVDMWIEDTQYWINSYSMNPHILTIHPYYKIQNHT